MGKMLLVGPYKNAGLRVGQYLSPPLGIYRIKSFIEKKTDWTVDVIDIDLKGKKYLIDLLKKKYDIIGFSLLQPTLKNDIGIINEAKKLSPDSLLIAGGQGAVFNYSLILNKTPVNAVVRGFGEFALLELINNLNQLQRVKGIFYKEGNKVIETSRKEPYNYEEFREISLSFDFDKVLYEEYWEYMERFYTKKHLKIMKNEDFLYTIRVMTSSHCPGKCAFCSSTNFLDNISCRMHQRIALTAEDAYILVRNALRNHPKCRAIYFNDDDFLFDKERIRKLCRLLKNIHGISYFCLSRLDNADEKLLRSMREAGFKFIIYGVESFSNKILKDMHKNLAYKNSMEQSKEAVKKTIRAGITPLMNLILFFPTTSVKDIIETIENTLELVECGARLTVYPYIEAYPGSNILKQPSLNLTYEKFHAGKNEFRLPLLILPSSDEIRLLASKSIKLRGESADKFLRKYNWKGVVPHPLHGLTLFLAVYRVLGFNTDRIEHLIDKMMLEESKQAITHEAIKTEVAS
jgi:radical SAM superfamily enzyme YgiQ (UPF0313 family)